MEKPLRAPRALTRGVVFRISAFGTAPVEPADHPICAAIAPCFPGETVPDPSPAVDFR